jgi:hypothetical protein
MRFSVGFFSSFSYHGLFLYGGDDEGITTLGKIQTGVGKVIMQKKTTTDKWGNLQNGRQLVF